MKINIRKADISDAALIAELIRSIGYFTHINEEEPQITNERVKRHLALCLEDNCHMVYVAEDQKGIVVGYCSVHLVPYFILKGPEGFVSELFIHESFRGQGIGGRLLETVEAAAKEKGYARLSLINLRKRESYQRGFYRKHGWIERTEAASFVFNLE